MTTATTMVHVRVFLTRIAADQALPFVLRTSNAASRAAIAQADEMSQNHRVRFAEADVPPVAS